MADVKVREVMTTDVVTLEPDMTIHDAARVLADHHISGAPVLRGSRLVGIISESDLIAAAMPPVHIDRGRTALDVVETFITGRAHPREGHVSVEDFMSPYVVSMSAEDSIWHAAAVMDRHGIKRLPVIERDGSLIGIVSRADVVGAMARTDDNLARDVTEAIRVLGEETIPDLYVRSSDGIVTVRGEADRRSTKELALKLASRTPGVLEVIDRLRYRHDDVHDNSFRPLQDPKDPRLDWHRDPVGTDR